MRKSIKSRLVKLAFNPTLIIVLSIINLVLINNYHNDNNTYALEYQSNTGVEFTINPTITISITGDHNGNLVINNLTPSNASDSNIINIVTESNAISGYSLYSTVGSDSNGTSIGNPSTELRRNGTDTTNKFTSITTNKSSLSDFNGSDWGYSYCNGDNTICTTTSDNWVSGNTGSTLSGYNGLPLYDSSSNNNNGSNNTAGIKLVDTTTSGTTTISFKIGAKASNSQIAGDYTNTINFIGVAKPNPQPIYMQNLDSSLCTTTPTYAVDNRDNNIYLIQRLADGNCWMLDNLRLDLTDPAILNSLSTSNTHVDEASLISLRSGNRSAGAQYASSGFSTWDSGNPDNKYSQAKANAGYKDTAATSYGAGSGKIGVYYNYCAASAGNYCYNQNASLDDPDSLQDAKYDLCPHGWRMPTSSSYGEYQNLYTVYNSSATDFRAALSTPLSGYFSNGLASNQDDYGYFWSSTWYYSYYVYRLVTYSGGVNPSNVDSRGSGSPVRCLLNS